MRGREPIQKEWNLIGQTKANLSRQFFGVFQVDRLGPYVDDDYNNKRINKHKFYYELTDLFLNVLFQRLYN